MVDYKPLVELAFRTYFKAYKPPDGNPFIDGLASRNVFDEVCSALKTADPPASDSVARRIALNTKSVLKEAVSGTTELPSRRELAGQKADLINRIIAIVSTKTLSPAPSLSP